MTFFAEAAVLLGAAIIAVPLFQRLGLGSILGIHFRPGPILRRGQRRGRFGGRRVGSHGKWHKQS